MEKKYIFDKEITGIVEIAERTPQDEPFVELLFADGVTERIPKRRYDILASAAPRSRTEAKSELFKKVGSSLYSILFEYGIQMSEIDSIINELVGLVNNASDKATNYLWGVESPNDRSLNQINNVLLSYGKYEEQEDTDGTPSDGSGVDTEDKE